MTQGCATDTERAKRLLESTAEALRTLTPQQRDRLMQLRLAEARGARVNGRLLFSMTGMLLRAERTARSMEEPHGGQ